MYLIFLSAFIIFCPFKSIGAEKTPRLSSVVNQWFRGQSVEKLKQLQSRYEIVFKQFQNEVCSPQDSSNFQELYKKYRSEGVFIPLKDEKLNIETIKLGTKLWKEKLKWIKDLIKKLSQMATLNDPAIKLERLKKLLDENLKIQFELASSRNGQEDNRSQHLLVQAKLLVDQFKAEYGELEKDIFYLFSYQYPVDHLSNRFKFEHSKQLGENVDELFMLRKVLEDGALDKELKGSDTFLRTTLDTFRISLNTQGVFFDRRFRADYDYLFGAITRYASQGKQIIFERLVEWSKRIEFTISFYQELAESEKKSREVANNYSEATQLLQSFVTAKLASVYRFWSTRPPELKMIFVLETILLHEVGPLDPLELEKSWVGQVVINRINKPGYEHLKEQEELAVQLRKMGIDPNDLWLNVLLRKGEFSFTYFFLPSSLRVFCVDQSPSAKNLRNQNIRLSIHILRHADMPDRLIEAQRYFSRVSMLGRIDMGKIWTNFAPVEERPGKGIIPTMEQINCVNEGTKCYRYLYNFFWQGDPYFVIEMLGNKVVWRRDSGRNYFWTVRDLDLFQFFRPINQTKVDQEITQGYISSFK